MKKMSLLWQKIFGKNVAGSDALSVFVAGYRLCEMLQVGCACKR